MFKIKLRLNQILNSLLLFIAHSCSMCITSNGYINILPTDWLIVRWNDRGMVVGPIFCLGTYYLHFLFIIQMKFACLKCNKLLFTRRKLRQLLSKCMSLGSNPWQWSVFFLMAALSMLPWTWLFIFFILLYKGQHRFDVVCRFLPYFTLRMKNVIDFNLISFIYYLNKRTYKFQACSWFQSNLISLFLEWNML